MGYHALRTDGLIPTIVTRADLVVIKWGRRLTPLHLLALMGFPMRVHPAVVGVCGFSLLCWMQPAPDQPDDDSGYSS